MYNNKKLNIYTSRFEFVQLSVDPKRRNKKNRNKLQENERLPYSIDNYYFKSSIGIGPVFLYSCRLLLTPPAKRQFVFDPKKSNVYKYIYIYIYRSMRFSRGCCKIIATTARGQRKGRALGAADADATEVKNVIAMII